MAQAPLREHYDSDEDYFRELDIYNTQVSSDLDSISDALGITVSRDAQDRPVIDGIVQPYEERYLHTRYGTDENGAGFTADYTTISGLIVFQGVRNSDVPAESTNPAEYTWREITVSSGWAPYFRTLGGRQIDWVFTTTVPTGYTLDDSGTVVDLDSLPGAVGAPGQSAIQALVSYSNGRVIVRAPNNGDYTPAPVDSVITTRVDVIFQSTEGGTVFARLSKNVSYNTTTNVFSQELINHPSGDLNVASVTVSPTITANGVELSFAYDANNRQANAEAEVFLVQGGGAGPSNLRRFRIAADAGIAGRPSTASGLDANWVDNPDLLDSGTLFESTQQVVVTQDGNPYSTDLTFSGTSGGVYVPAQPEIQTITVDSTAQTSTNDPGSPEIIRFTPSGDPGDRFLGEITATLLDVPGTITFDNSLTDGGASVSVLIEVNFADGSSDSYTEALDLGDYASANGITSGTAVNTLDFLTAALANEDFNGLTNSADMVTKTGDDYTLSITNLFSGNEWVSINPSTNRLTIYGSADPFPGGADGTVGGGTGYFRDWNEVLSPTVLGAETAITIPYISDDGEQMSITRTVAFLPEDTTSALQSARIVSLLDFLASIDFFAFEATSAVDGDDVVITGNNPGDVTGNVVLVTTQNTGNMMFTTPIITEGVAAENASDVTFRFEDNDGMNQDLTVMFTSQLDANGIASAISNAVTAVTYTVTSTDLTYSAGDTGFLTSGFWNFRGGTSSLSSVLTPSSWPTSGFLRMDEVDGGGFFQGLRDRSGLTDVTLTLDDDSGNTATYDVSQIVSDSSSLDEVIVLDSLVSSTGVVPNEFALVMFTLSVLDPPVGFNSASSNNVVTITSEENEPRAQTTIVNVDAGTNGNIASGSFTIATIQDGVVADSIITGTRSTVTINGATSQSITLDPGSNLGNISVLTNELSEDDQEMYITSSGGTLSLESYSRALGGDFTFTATFNPGDSSTASMVQSNEVSGTNEVHDGTQTRWSRAIQVGTI